MSSTKKMTKYKCPYCDKRFTREELVIHVEEVHDDMIPENYCAFQIVFNYINKKPLDYNGKCTECGGPTKFDINKGRYNRQCDKPSCKESYLKKFENNMLRTKGVTRISSTAEGQAKMLANRKISGSYKFQNGVEKTYTGSYELKTLEFMDKVMNINPDDIMCPGPILEYTYEGKRHMYITDFYYIPYNLVIEVKDGGKNPNKRDMPDYRGKQIAKEKYIIKNTNYNYLRLTDNDLSQLLSIFMDLKMQMTENTEERVVHVNESVDTIFESFDFNEILIESTKSNIDKDYKPKGKKNLSSFKIVHITEAVIEKYKKEYPFLSHVRCKDTDYYICDGYIWFDGNELVAMVGSCEYTDDKTKWIVSLEITKNYKGYGLSKQILDYATKTMKCKYLSVNKNNKIAKKVYDDYGFKVYQESDTMYYMTIDKNIKESFNILTENLILNKKDIYKDFEKFESGKSNVLLITGFSGSGKSTLAKEMSNKYKCDYFELDALDFYLGKNMSLEDAENGEPALASFIKHKQLKQEIPKQNEYSKLYEEYLEFVVNWCKRRKPERFIIEGLQIYEIFNNENPQSFITSNPIILKGTSGLLSALRGAKRNSSSNKKTTFFKEFKGLLGWVIQDNKQLKKLEKSLNEAMNALMTGYIPGVESPGSVYVVNYMQNNVFSGDEERGYGISDNPKLTNLICRNKEGKLSKAPKDFLQNCKYDVYLVDKSPEEISKTLSPFMDKFVSESFIYESVFGKKMYTYDQIMTEDSAIPVIDYYKGLDLLGECVRNFILGKSKKDEFIVCNENSIMSFDMSDKDLSCISYTSIKDGNYRIESVDFPELVIESTEPIVKDSIEAKFLQLLTYRKRGL